ncbi:hypothetical protein BC629DRAFT_1460027 [Irpex lacteus]|nr:hypothetical protein BC629DRAFT_1460027 [Irpex lacteus]
MEANGREVFMNIPAVRGQLEQSFEELRVHDYIKAYSATGRPPQPVPPLPLHPGDRARAGLPPLFVPYVEVNGVPSQDDSMAMSMLMNEPPVTGPPPQDLNALPDVQTFTVTPDTAELGQTAYYQSIVAQHTYSAFSFEELRYQAYRSGKKIIPEALGSSRSIPSLLVTPPVTAPASGPRTDQFQSITCTPPFQKHSFEELRLAHRRTGREMTSDQIFQARVI